jgi:NADH-quinone oxidoreductase subunit J
MGAFLFYVAAVVTLGGALLVLILPNPLRAAMAMIASLCGLSVVYLMLHAQFVAVMQILVYAGAILVLFVFVIMLLNLEDTGKKRSLLAWVGAAGLMVFSVLVVHWLGVGRLGFSVTGDNPVRVLPKDFGSVEVIGQQILGDFVLPFEMLSVLLLVAVVGAVVISKKRL